MKLNVGCGYRKMDGYLNVDKFDDGDPDLVMDAEVTPWPFGDNTFADVAFIHSLEHMGAQTDVFFGVMKELYRVCKPLANVVIVVPHPRHDNFINDPTHVRIITPDVLSLFSKRRCRDWIEAGDANSPLALYLDVDFEVLNAQMKLEQKHARRREAGEITQAQLFEIIGSENNVVIETRITVQVIKPEPALSP
jgi:SAM-dependent methyltransferase